ncbi:Bug family tripartite tricarboxylate transporter substrate binding protein [Bordetella genomosp. 1]|nr:tripartite tricarboxylate transporter substrate binding protein [Bordetella genomosp. 1]
MITRRQAGIYMAMCVMGAKFSNALASTWPAPESVIRLVVPFSPGGTTDILGRMMADGLRKELGVSVIVENLAGANGNLGATNVLRAKADGLTLMLGTPGPMIVNKYVYSNLNYDPLTAFSHVALVAALPNVLMVRKELPVNSVADLVALAGKKDLSFGSPGVGSSGHVSSELFNLQSKIKAAHIPYKGSSPMLVDLAGGNIDYSIDQISSALKLVQAGQIRALAVTSKERSPELPDVPTLQEAGLSDYEVSVWFCIAAPAKTPPETVLKLNAAINKVLQDPAVIQRIAGFGARPLGGHPEDLTRQVQVEQQNIIAVAKVVNFSN